MNSNDFACFFFKCFAEKVNNNIHKIMDKLRLFYGKKLYVQVLQHS